MYRKHIFFDCYQTLLDTDIDRERQKVDQLNGWEIFVGLLNERHDIRISPELFIELLERRKAEYYQYNDKRVHHHDLLKLVTDVLRKDLQSDLANDAVSELLYEYRKVSRGFVTPYPKVREVLSKLSEKYTLSVASYTQAIFTLSELKKFGIDEFFSHFIFTSDIGFRKSSLDFYRECVHIVGTEPKDCMMVGDNYHEDILVPAELGIEGIWIRNPKTCRDDSPSLGDCPVPIVELESFEALPKTVDDLFSRSDKQSDSFAR
ncbi:MAG: HAD family hydrolase [Candidatus Moraniibacteriota bacterium]